MARGKGLLSPALSSRGGEGENTISLSDLTRLPRPARNERGEGWGEGLFLAAHFIESFVRRITKRRYEDKPV